jgi:VWFA-related protein
LGKKMGISTKPRLLASRALLFILIETAAIGAQQPLPPPIEVDRANVQTPGGYVIQRDVSLVVLHASVFNQRGQFVPGLNQESFHVYEDKAEQKISVFRQEDIPVTLGLVIDNSGSMRDKRPSVNAAALALVKASNPEDETFVVNFNDDYYLDTAGGFTNDIDERQSALERIDSRGSTALYDAVIGSLDHLKKGRKDKKVLVLITDGADTASRRNLQTVVQEAQRSEAVIYAVAVFSKDDLRHNRGEVKKARRALTDLANATGGMALFPETPDDTAAICTQIARDIRQQYTI